MYLTLPDKVIEPYVRMAQARGCGVEEVLIDQLRRFAGLNPSKKAIVVGGEDLERLQRQLQVPIPDGAALAARVSRLAKVSIEAIDLHFTTGQLEEIAYRAQRQGKDPRTLVAEIVRQIEAQFFHVSGGGPATPKGKATPQSVTGVGATRDPADPRPDRAARATDVEAVP